MKKILSKLINFINYPLLFLSLGLILLGILFTYGRLEKSLVDAIPVFLPFAFVIIMFIINIFYKKAKINENLLFNFSAFVVFLVIIIVGLRAKFDTNMILYYKYGIKYNPSYLADNLSAIKVLLYCLGATNIFAILSSLLEEKELPKLVNEVPRTINEVKDPNKEVIKINNELKENIEHKEEELL